jgi:hypothetical protein
MTPAGYMLKRVAQRPDWLDMPRMRDIYSVSGCISEDFADYINYWKHNGYWLFDSPRIIAEIAAAANVSTEGMKLFYYEVHEQEYDEEACQWGTISWSPDAAFVTNVVVPEQKSIEGYDVVSFWARNAPECSPLSCNSLAKTIAVNEHCLIPTFEQTIAAIESGKFKNGEPGPLRVFAVYSMAGPQPG